MNRRKVKSTTVWERIHLSHCNQGEYEGSCKYGDADCPALKKATKATTVSKHLPVEKIITQLEVQKSGKGKHWIITKCDGDPEAIGKFTICGVPAPASDMPVGTTFQTIWTIPK
jgi:hypothetical protein